MQQNVLIRKVGTPDLAILTFTIQHSIEFDYIGEFQFVHITSSLNGLVLAVTFLALIVKGQN